MDRCAHRRLGVYNPFWVAAVERLSMSKYRAKIVVADGLRFHSQGEYARWLELRILEAAGKIKALKRQVSYALRIAGHPLLIRSDRYPNGRGCRYVADFEYVEDGIRIVEDYKGFD